MTGAVCFTLLVPLSRLALFCYLRGLRWLKVLLKPGMVVPSAFYATDAAAPWEVCDFLIEPTGALRL